MEKKITDDINLNRNLLEFRGEEIEIVMLIVLKIVVRFSWLISIFFVIFYRSFSHCFLHFVYFFFVSRSVFHVYIIFSPLHFRFHYIIYLMAMFYMFSYLYYFLHCSSLLLFSTPCLFFSSFYSFLHCLLSINKNPWPFSLIFFFISSFDFSSRPCVPSSVYEYHYFLAPVRITSQGDAGGVDNSPGETNMESFLFALPASHARRGT